VKNLGIALHPYRSSSYFIGNAKMAAKLLVGERVGDYLPKLVELSAQLNFTSTIFAVSRRGHRRDPAYEIADVKSSLQNAVKSGCTAGLHGSYRSIVEDRSLAEERKTASRHLQYPVIANRQHWLRFFDQQDLWEEVSGAGFIADSSLGFSERVGFRNGAAFAFPPYDLRREQPHSFLEIPLALMDGSLEACSRETGCSPQTVAAQVLKASRDLGWGGIAILWHNPLEALSVPAEINDVFWELAESKTEHCEEWVSVEQFLEICLERYREAGLLKEIRLPARTASQSVAEPRTMARQAF
jgi:hypothetical protein